MVGGIGHAHQVLVGPSIQVCVLPADDAVACVAGLALAAVHGVAVVAQVAALGVLVAVVRPVRAGVARLAHLRAQRPEVNAEPSRVPVSLSSPWRRRLHEEERGLPLSLPCLPLWLYKAISSPLSPELQFLLSWAISPPAAFSMDCLALFLNPRLFAQPSSRLAGRL